MVSSVAGSSVSIAWISLDRLGASCSGGDLTGDLASDGFFAVGEPGAWSWLIVGVLVSGDTAVMSLLGTAVGLDSGSLVVESLNLAAALPSEVSFGGDIG